MPTITTETSKELVTRLFEKEFNSIDMSLDYIYGKLDVLIKAANDFGLDELAEYYTEYKRVYNL